VSANQKCHSNKQLSPTRFRPEQSGFSLLEVLIASTIFSFGLAGFAALLLASIIGSAEARKEGIASMVAANLSEQIRLNPLALGRYLNPPEYVSRICAGDNQCSPEQQADYDFRLWQLELADSIQNARGLVCHDGTPQDGIEGDNHCDGSGPLVIKIFWNGQGTDDMGEPNVNRFILEIS
jgi:type IV pilus modification protein PilV